MKNFLYKSTIIYFLILIFIKKDIMYITIYNTTITWFKNIVPNLLPMFIISSYIINSSLIHTISNMLGNTFKKLFKISPYGIYVYILSLFTGSPSNAKYIKDLKDNNLLTETDKNKLILFTLNYNPILIISLLSFLNKKDIYIIIFILILTNIIIGLLNRKNYEYIKNNEYIEKKISLQEILKNTMDTLIMILGTLIFFNLIINLLPIKNPILKNILNGFLEITTALKNLHTLNINYNTKLLLSLIYLSFGGLSIHMQIKSILPDTNYNLFLKNRILCILISIVLLILFVI